MDLSTAIFLNSLFAFAALVVSVTGFGFAMIATPIAILILPPAQAVPVVVLSWLPLSLLLAVNCFRTINAGRVLRLYACAMVGVPVGVHVLATFDTGLMRTATGLVALAGAGMMALHSGKPFRSNALPICGAGLLSGLMGGCQRNDRPSSGAFGAQAAMAARSIESGSHRLLPHPAFLDRPFFRTWGLLEIDAFTTHLP